MRYDTITRYELNNLNDSMKSFNNTFWSQLHALKCYLQIAILESSLGLSGNLLNGLAV